MALVDVSELLTDPDFTDRITLVRRLSMINVHGEMVLTESESENTMVVQAPDAEMLNRAPEGANLSGAIQVYSREPLFSGLNGGYSDVIVHAGERYQVNAVANYLNYGAGYVLALCTRESVTASVAA